MPQESSVKLGGPGNIVPPALIMTLIHFDNSLYPKLLRLSPTWHTSVTQALDFHCNPFENDFVNTYTSELLFRTSYI